jgi:hypothetical protein
MRSVSSLLAREQRERVRKRIANRLAGLLDAAGTAGEVDDQSGSAKQLRAGASELELAECTHAIWTGRTDRYSAERRGGRARHGRAQRARAYE